MVVEFVFSVPCPVSTAAGPQEDTQSMKQSVCLLTQENKAASYLVTKVNMALSVTIKMTKKKKMYTVTKEWCRDNNKRFFGN